MRLLAVAAAIAAPIVISLGLVGTTPALADGGCNWGNTNGGVNNYPPGDAIAVNGIVFSCSSGGANPDVWIPAGTTSTETPGLDGYYDGSQAPGTFGVGATLIDESGDAWVLGSSWDDVGSFSDFLGGLTECVDTSCSPGGVGLEL